MKNEEIIINYGGFRENVKELSNQCTKMEETYKNIEEVFNRLKDAHMESQATEILGQIYDEWEEINRQRLKEIQDNSKLLQRVLETYEKAFSEIENEVGEL